MFGSMQRRWEMRRLQSRLESARRPPSPIMTASSSWAQRVGEQPDASHVADAIEACEALEAKVRARQEELEAVE